MKKSVFLLLLPALFFQNCSFLEQRNFMETKIISSNKNEKIIYKYYQTRQGEYKVDFYSVRQSDSTKLFEHTIDHALFTANTYSISENKNGLIIKTKLFPEERKLVTQGGKSIILTR